MAQLCSTLHVSALVGYNFAMLNRTLLRTATHGLYSTVPYSAMFGYNFAMLRLTMPCISRLRLTQVGSA